MPQFPVGGGACRAQHEFLTSLTGLQCCCRCLGGHGCCCHLTITAKTWATQKTPPRSLVIKLVSREPGLNVHIQLYDRNNIQPKDYRKKLLFFLLLIPSSPHPPLHHQAHTLTSANSEMQQGPNLAKL